MFNVVGEMWVEVEPNEGPFFKSLSNTWYLFPYLFLFFLKKRTEGRRTPSLDQEISQRAGMKIRNAYVGTSMPSKKNKGIRKHMEKIRE